jgi:MOSC domain-containing protein YiiM
MPKVMPTVVSLSKSQQHTFSKSTCQSITLIQGEGVAGDAHRGVFVKHHSRVKANPCAPNLRQVHLIHHELISELQEKGFNVEAASMGENIMTQGIDLLALPRDTKVNIGQHAVIQITGLRNPCKQLDNYQKGLMTAVLDKDDAGNIIRKAGVMGVVLKGGDIYVGDTIKILFPQKPYLALERV